jgi:hypothetical protein
MVTRIDVLDDSDLCGNYDKNMIRMVTGIQNGFRWGFGPSKDDPGCDITCCTM